MIAAADACAACARACRRAPALARSASRPPIPTGYGRLIERDGALVAIREQKDASAAGARDPPLQRRPDGDRRRARARACSTAIGADNAAREFYLTDLVEIAAARRPRGATRWLADEEEVMGVNDRVQLAARRGGDAAAAARAARCSAARR